MLSEERIKLMDDIGMIWDTIKNKGYIKEICNKYEIKYKDYIEILSKAPYKETIAKIVFLKSKGIPIKINDEIHEIFSMSSLNMKSKYGIDLKELIETYGVKYDKEYGDSSVYSKILK